MNSDAHSFKSKKSKVSKSEGLWLMSFADMIMTLLAFMVLMVSMSQVNKRKMEEVQNAMKEESKNEKRPTLQGISENIATEIRRLGLDKAAVVSYDVNGVAVEFQDALFFAPGSANLNPKAASATDQVLALLAHTPQQYSLTLEGHTDDTPMVAGGAFPTNWELSSARGLAMLRTLEKRGIKTERMSVQAFAHTRPRTPTGGKFGRELDAARASNRRVVVRIQ